MNKLAIINELQPIAARMRERQETINAEQTTLNGQISTLVLSVWDQARDCLVVKAKLPRTIKWSEWLGAHVPQLSSGDASKYERILAEQLDDPRQCLFAFLPPAKQTTRSKRATPPQHELAWACVAKLARLIRDNPLDKWPARQLDLLREQLLPIVRSLWPRSEFAGPSSNNPRIG